MSSFSWNKKNMKNTDIVVNINYLFISFIFTKSLSLHEEFIPLYRSSVLVWWQIWSWETTLSTSSYKTTSFILYCCQRAVQKWEHDTSATYPLAFSYFFMFMNFSKLKDQGPLKLFVRLSIVVTKPTTGKKENPSSFFLFLSTDYVRIHPGCWISEPLLEATWISK